MTQNSMKKTFLSILVILLFRASVFPTPLPGDTLQIFNGHSVTWDKPATINETYIRINSGGLLTVTDTAWMKPNAKIIVMPGGRMVIDNGMLTGFCSWAGIEVWGNDNLSQTTANQGKIEIKNGGTIQMPDNLKSTEIERAQLDLLKIKPASRLEVHPNPAKDFVILGHQLDFEPEYTQISIRNLKWELIKTLIVDQKENQITVDTGTWHTGVYFISLVHNGELIETVKLSIEK